MNKNESLDDKATIVNYNTYNNCVVYDGDIIGCVFTLPSSRIIRIIDNKKNNNGK